MTPNDETDLTADEIGAMWERGAPTSVASGVPAIVVRRSPTTAAQPGHLVRVACTLVAWAQPTSQADTDHRSAGEAAAWT